MFKTEDLKTTNVDMMPELLANQEKLISEDRRKYYADYGHQMNLDEDTEQFISKDDVFMKNNTFKNNTQMHTFDNNSENMTMGGMNKEDDINLRKMNILRKLSELVDAGVVLSKKYSMDSEISEMEFEYQLHHDVRAKRNSIAWMSNMTLNLVYGIEMMNETYDPFSLKLKGWAEQMNADIDNYYDIFGELYEKYNQPGKSMPPEIKLLFALSGSAFKFHMQNTLIKAIPNLNALSNNEALTEQLRKQAFANKANNHVQKEHEEVSGKLRDINMLRQRELEKQRKELELEQLQNTLNNIHISDNASLKEKSSVHLEMPSISPFYKQNNKKENMSNHSSDIEMSDSPTRKNKADDFFKNNKTDLNNLQQLDKELMNNISIGGSNGTKSGKRKKSSKIIFS